jgi:hypothetical protein
MSTVSASGQTRLTPFDMAIAISMPVRLSLNPWGAITTFFMNVSIGEEVATIWSNKEAIYDGSNGI